MGPRTATISVRFLALDAMDSKRTRRPEGARDSERTPNAGRLQQLDVREENLRAPATHRVRVFDTKPVGGMLSCAQSVNGKYGTDLPKIAPRGLDLCQTELSALGPPSSEKQHRRSSLGRL